MGLLNRRDRIKAASGVILAIAVCAITSCGNKQQAGASAAPQGPLPVTVVKVKSEDVPLMGQWVGTLDGFVNAQIQPRVSGNVVRQNYREGSVVKKDQVLFEIDPRPFQAAVDQARGQLESAKAQIAQTQGQVAQAQAQVVLAEINLNRDTPLAKARAIAQSQVDNEKQTLEQQKASLSSAKAAVQSAQAAVLSAEAVLEAAQLNLGFTRVRSLIGGVAGQATTQVGNLVNAQSVLTSVSQLDPIKVYFSISDSQYLTLNARARARGGDLLSGSAVPLTLALANGETYPQKGRIAFIDRQIDQQTGAIRIAAVFPNPKNLLRPGQFGRVNAETDMRRGALLVPQIAVQELQGLQQVFTVSQDNKAHVLTLMLGPQHGSDWIVNGGLNEGTSVITDNLQKLKEGVPVAPHEGRAPAQPNSPLGQQQPAAGK